MTINHGVEGKIEIFNGPTSLKEYTIEFYVSPLTCFRISLPRYEKTTIGSSESLRMAMKVVAYSLRKIFRMIFDFISLPRIETYYGNLFKLFEGISYIFGRMIFFSNS